MESSKGASAIITIENHTYEFEKSAAEWLLTLRKSEVQVSEEKDLALLKVAHPLLMATGIHWEEDEVTFTYHLPKESISFSELKSRPKEDKLRAMANMMEVKQLLDLPLTFFIHPENILFDYNLVPTIAYRGLEGKMPPQVINEELLLRQYKSLIIALFEKDQDFSKLYEGQLDIKKGSKFIQTIIGLDTFEAIRQYLIENYEQTVTELERTTRKVSKRSFTLIKQLSIWMSVLSVVLVVPLVYLLFFQIPFLDRMQDTDTAFLKNDYEGVISTLEPIKTEDVPYTQKYELAYSFVQGEALQDKQKTVILNNITLRSDKNYLDFWIENGRGNLDEALDIAKKLEDSDLILYGITQKIEQVRNDANLSGTEKEETIGALESDYEKYKEKRNTSIEEATAETTTEAAAEATTETTGTSQQEGN
ncbi:type VII secretion protein EssB [Enterococcus sp. BWM-S5]|uniref:Type VII secretion protein EssB n=1 Tax=Enterococcus larvae TaxID=2794352 RepID=A0ABS4CEF8_9ENTE|nr:type VII secretion protein EssB [Enterococcus larvae]MBP1044999.1 type VII secretion protein EssB [Enterococcus larvae]